jgi:hypothetical protein
MRSRSFYRDVEAGAPAPAGPALLPLLALTSLLPLFAALPVGAATILDKSVEIEIRADGSVDERQHLEVRIDRAGDLGAWSPFPIWIDERHTLAKVEAWVRRPDGTTEKLGRQAFDTVEASPEWVLHSSTQARLVRFPGVPAGGVLGLDYERVGRPYFPEGRVEIGADAAISRLRVHVRGGGAGWRWAIAGPTAGLHTDDSSGELLITASDLRRPADIDDAPDEIQLGPVLRYAWSGEATWPAVGRWYDDLARDVPRHGDQVRAAARRILAGTAAGGGAAGDPAADRRRQLAAILAYVRREVRYVAVEVGVGGYRPAPATETLERRWGDCKGKVELLLDLLSAAGIEAFPALARVAPGGRVDPEFPTPGAFNHMIAAVPLGELAIADGDPVAGGYLFVDPTQTDGGIGWLSPGDQDQLALVLRPGGGELVRTPLLPRLDSSKLAGELTVDAEGAASGHLRLELRGAEAAAAAAALAAESPEQTDARTRRLIAGWLPGATVSAMRWLPSPHEDVPAAVLTAEVAVPSLMTAGVSTSGEAGTATEVRSISLAGPRTGPAPGTLHGRKEPIVLRAHVEEVSWRLALPAGWCPAQHDSTGVDNPAGSFHQSVACAEDHLTIERRTELRQRWVDAPQIPALEEIVLAERRAGARRLRLDRLHG